MRLRTIWSFFPLLIVFTYAGEAAADHTSYGSKPVHEIQLLAQKGDPMAEAELGLDYENGFGLPV